jgi:hypothetical protein
MEEAKETNLTTGLNLDSNENFGILAAQPTESQDGDDISAGVSVLSVLPDLRLRSGGWNTSSSPDCLNQKHISGRTLYLSKFAVR